MKTTLLETPEDMQWLKEVHMPHLDLSKWKFAVLHGNEDAPAKVVLFARDDVFGPQQTHHFPHNEEAK